MLNSTSTVFPNVWTRVVSSVVHFFSACTLSFVLARRTASSRTSSLTTSLGNWRNVSIARVAVICAFTDSLLFILFSGVLVHGAGLELNKTSCTMAFFACVFLYASSKLFIYIFLTERVWIVWSNWATPKDPSRPPSRWRSPIYLLCVFSLALYASCPVLALKYPVRHTEHLCYIGLQRPSSLLLLSYDVYITVLLTSLFIYPLARDKIISPQLRRVASRTLIASLVALVTSALNVTVLTILQGTERGWICITSCGSDVCVNALVVYSVTEVGRRSKAVTASVIKQEESIGGNGRRRRVRQRWKAVEAAVRKRAGRRRASGSGGAVDAEAERVGSGRRHVSTFESAGQISSFPRSWFSRGIRTSDARRAFSITRGDATDSIIGGEDGKKRMGVVRDEDDAERGACDDVVTEVVVGMDGENNGDKRGRKGKGKGKVNVRVKVGNSSPIASIFSGLSGRGRRWSRREGTGYAKKEQRVEMHPSNQSRSSMPSRSRSRSSSLSRRSELHQDSTIMHDHSSTRAIPPSNSSFRPHIPSPSPFRSRSPSPSRSRSRVDPPPASLRDTEFFQQDTISSIPPSSSHPHSISDPTPATEVASSLTLSMLRSGEGSVP